MYKQAQMYTDIAKVVEELGVRCVDGKDGTEMEEVELAFLCGLIQEKKPKKILEVGVSAGGTTAVILKCIEDLGLDTQVISVDKAEKYYRDPQKNVGYLVEQCKEKLGTYGQWRIYRGWVYDCIDIIGENKDIDFCILDTVHSLPGEVLDFLVCYPYMTDNAVVVVHDLLENLFVWDIRPSASRILFDTVFGTKYLMWDPYGPTGLDGYPTQYPNIGAFEILPETGEHIMDVLSGLMSKWGGQRLEDAEICTIKNIFRKNYDSQFCRLFDEILNLRVKIDVSSALKDHIGKGNDLCALLHKWKKSSKIALYGAGDCCRKYSDFARVFELQVDAVVVSDEMPVMEINYLDCKICHLSELEEVEQYGFVICIYDREERMRLERFLEQQGRKIINLTK